MNLTQKNKDDEPQIILKSLREIELMRDAGHIVFMVHEKMREMVKPGVNLQQLNTAAEDIIADAGGIALFRGVESPPAKFSFPAAICTSVNEQVVHGIPVDRELVEGDIVSVDCGVRLKGYCGDSAITLPVGTVDSEATRLMEVTRLALDLALDEMHPHAMWSHIAAQVQGFVEDEGFSVVRDFVGHGIGQGMHEAPKVRNYLDPNEEGYDFKLEPGLVIAVEPMVNVASHEIKIGDETGWPQVTKDGRLSAHFEHTVAVTKDGIDILTNK